MAEVGEETGDAAAGARPEVTTVVATARSP